MIIILLGLSALIGRKLSRGADGTAVFLKVAAERSFSRAAMKLHRTQPAVSQAVRRLEESVGERLFDRATKDATLTDAGRLLRDYAERLLRLSEEAETAVKDLRDLRRGRVLIGANEASVHAVLPLIQRYREAHPLVHVDVRRIPARQIGAEVAQGTPRLRRAHVPAGRAAARARSSSGRTSSSCSCRPPIRSPTRAK